jgi:ppGpp synthetase/RelA/SpoT-type nucleotidyltranferase
MVTLSDEGATSKWVRLYELERPKYEAYCIDIRRIIHEILKDTGINFSSIESRAKNVESFRKKTSKTDENGRPKYTEPLKEITDLAAVRVIVFTNSYVQKECDVIEHNFTVQWKKDVGEERSNSKDFGYQSVHYLVSHTDERLKLQDFKKFGKMICEVQVRTILQHAWAEIEHDIQYKSENEIPKEIGRKFRALAGLVEIADREFQSIQDLDSALKDAIRKSAANELTKDAINQLDAQSGIGATSDTNGSKDVDVPLSEPASARGFILEGKYEQALQIYDRNISLNPNAHTQYIGRAKVRFLLGDRSGALVDLDSAQRLAPGDPALAAIRFQIEQGAVKIPSTELDAFDEYKQGTKALSEGKGEAAFISFSNAQEAGYNYVFSVLNKAMACVLAGDIMGGRAFLEQLRRKPDTPMEINIVALNCIIDLLEGNETSANFAELEALLEKKPEFNLELSPLNNLKFGMAARRGPGASPTDAVFNLLSRIQRELHDQKTSPNALTSPR